MKTKPTSIVLISTGMLLFAGMRLVDALVSVFQGRPYRIDLLTFLAPFLMRFGVQLYKGVPKARREVLAFAWLFVIFAGFGVIGLLLPGGFTAVRALTAVSFGVFGGYAVVMLRSQAIRQLYEPPAGPTMRSSELPPAGAAGSRSP